MTVAIFWGTNPVDSVANAQGVLTTLLLEHEF
jgi:hypothetical protein